MFHVYIEYGMGEGYERLDHYTSQRGGQRPAAWEAQSTADYWRRRIAGKKVSFVQKCQHTAVCPVCRASKEMEAR